MNAQQPISNSQHPRENEKQNPATPPALPNIQHSTSNTQHPKKKNKTVTIIAIVFLAVISFIVIVYNIASRDIPPPDTSDLTLERPEIADEGNAHTYFNAAIETLYQPTNCYLIMNYLNGTNTDEEILAEIITKNSETFRLMNKGTKYNICLTPEISSFYTPTPYIGKWRAVAQVMSLKARHDRLCGNYSAATDSCIDLLNFGNLIQYYPECIIHQLVGVAVSRSALNQAEDIARDNAVPIDELLKLSTALSELKPFEHGLIRAIKAEYKTTSFFITDFEKNTKSITDLGSGEIFPLILRNKKLPRYFFQPNKTKYAFAEFARNAISNVPLTYAESPMLNGIDKGKEAYMLLDSKKLITRPNGMGNVICNMLMPAIPNLLEQRHRIEYQQIATRLITACNIYKRKNITLPTSLDILVPEYIDKIPIDPYDGKPFRYSSEKAIVYSVGTNLKDDNGSTKKMDGVWLYHNLSDRYKKEDIVFNVTEK